MQEEGFDPRGARRWHHRQRVEPRLPARLPSIDPIGTFGDDGTVDAGDVACGTHVRSDGKLGVGDRDGAGFDGDLEAGDADARRLLPRSPTPALVENHDDEPVAYFGATAEQGTGANTFHFTEPSAKRKRGLNKNAIFSPTP